MTETAKSAFKNAEEKYNKHCEEYKSKGIAYVPWNILKTARLYLHNKAVDCKCCEIMVDEHYQIIGINGYIGDKYIGTVILLPEDTEGKAYGKVDRCILDKLKEVK